MYVYAFFHSTLHQHHYLNIFYIQSILNIYKATQITYRHNSFTATPNVHVFFLSISLRKLKKTGYQHTIKPVSIMVELKYCCCF